MAIIYRASLSDSPMRSDDHHHPSDDDDDSGSDVSDDVVELATDEFPGYFQERDGRLFHSHGGCPYPLPVDADEQQVRIFQPSIARFWRSRADAGTSQRQNGLHQLLHSLIGAPAVGPVQELLASSPGEQRRVLDLGTGTGKWCGTTSA